jgi:type I pantothenate kinase
VLEARGLLDRKGFPESYDVGNFVRFLSEVKAGVEVVRAPVYSHVRYDIVAGDEQIVERPDIVIVEGLNVLQTVGGAAIQVADFFDFSIYVDASEDHIRRWFVDRFHALRATVFADPASFFHRYAELNPADAEQMAVDVWDRINGPNLRDHILPTRARATLVLEKDAGHGVARVVLQRR